MNTLENIINILRQHKADLQMKYPISGIAVFGSYSSGSATEAIDIDILVDINGPMGLNFVTMAIEIEKLLGIKTDVVPRRLLKPDFLRDVERNLIYV
ncbi:MAG TPA: nucleotidyltransferase family protein [Puia sp.]|nr:nucleotidyltransferase family protein [Puia sp.]